MKRTLIILTAFVLFFVLWYFNIAIRPLNRIIGDSLSAHYALNYLIAGLVPVGALFLLHTRRDILPAMGLSRGFGVGLLFAIGATLPMFIGYAFIGQLNSELTFDKALTWIVIAGLFEEIVFRGFIFGQLFRYAGWGFLPAALPTALVFGSLHLYQGHDLASALGSFGITALGSLFFSWIYVEWNYNLWSVIWLHVLMNAPWILFHVSASGAVGSTEANILRFSTIALSVLLTLYYKKRQQLPYLITSKTMIKNKIA